MTQETGHVNDHVMAGMNSYYQVAAQNECFKGFQPWVIVRDL